MDGARQTRTIWFAWAGAWAVWLVTTHSFHPSWLLAVIVTTSLLTAYAVAVHFNHGLLIPRFWRAGRRGSYVLALAAMMLVLTGIALTVIRASYTRWTQLGPDQNVAKHFAIDLFGMAVHLILAWLVVRLFTRSRPVPERAPPLWPAVLFQPRAVFGRIATGRHRAGAVMAAAAAGVVQSLIAVAGHQAAGRWTDVAVLPIAVGVGAAWGVLQTSLLGALLARGGSRPRLPGIDIGWASLPQIGALVTWGIGILIVGPALYLDPEFAMIAAGPSGLVVGVVVAVTVIGWIWTAARVAIGAATTDSRMLNVARAFMALTFLILAAVGFYRTSPWWLQ